MIIKFYWEIDKMSIIMIYKKKKLIRKLEIIIKNIKYFMLKIKIL